MTPQRIQRKRTKGWTMPDNTEYVGRPGKRGNTGKWGNPFPHSEVLEDYLAFWKKMDYKGLELKRRAEASAREHVVNRFRECLMDPGKCPDDQTRAKFQSMRERISDLQGRNLACWCPEGGHCHANVLLELANGPPFRQ
jgi:hypothetical protein